MSELYYINKNTLTNIADAIRAATGNTGAIEVTKLGQRASEAFIQKEDEYKTLLLKKKKNIIIPYKKILML